MCSLCSLFLEGDSGSNKKEYLQWDSQKHIQRLRNFSWDSLELGEDPFKNNNLAEVTVEQCVIIQATKTNPKDGVDELRYHFSYPVSLKCGSFSSSVTVLCYVIEALYVYGKTEKAVHLAMAVGLSIVRHYNTWLDGLLRIPVKDTLYVDYDEGEGPKEAVPANIGKRGKKGKRVCRKRARKGTNKTEIVDEKADKKSSQDLFNEETGAIPVTSVAFLLHILEENEELVAEMLKLVKVQRRDTRDEDMMDCDEVTSDAHSLIFRLGVVGSAMPKIKAPSLQIQVRYIILRQSQNHLPRQGS